MCEKKCRRIHVSEMNAGRSVRDRRWLNAGAAADASLLSWCAVEKRMVCAGPSQRVLSVVECSLAGPGKKHRRYLIGDGFINTASILSEV